MIWYHNHKNFKCFIDVGSEAEFEIFGKVIAIEHEYPGKSIGLITCVIKEFGRVATEQDIKKMNKLMVFK